MHQNCNQNRIFIQSMLGLNLFILISMLIFVNIILLISKFGRILHWIVKQIIIISLQELSHHLASGAENYLEVCNIVGEHNLCIVPKFKHVKVVSNVHSFAKIEFRWNSHANIQISFANIKICLNDPFQYLSLQFTYFHAFWQQKTKIIYGECFKGNRKLCNRNFWPRQFKIEISKLSQGYRDTWKKIEFSRHISKIRWIQNLSWDCLSPDSASAAFPSRPSEEMSPREETQNLKFPIYFLPPSPPIQSNKISYYFYLCLLLQNCIMLFVNLCKGSKCPTPLQTYFV